MPVFIEFADEPSHDFLTVHALPAIARHERGSFPLAVHVAW